MAPQLIPPLSRARRTFYTRLLFAIFFLAVPILFLYATGYRFAGLSELVRTGGVYVSAERSGAEIYINGELVRETGTFRRAFFVQDLEPGIYTIEVHKEGYHPWGKTLPVYAHLVTEAEAFNLPLEPELTLVPPRVVISDSASATTTAPNPLYEAVLEEFTMATAPRGATSSASTTVLATTTRESGGIQLSEGGGHVAARWTRSLSDIPFYFCTPESSCTDTIKLALEGGAPRSFDFFPGSSDLVVVSIDDGVYVIELDDRSGQNIQPLYPVAGADFRTLDGTIYVQTESGELYEVEV